MVVSKLLDADHVVVVAIVIIIAAAEVDGRRFEICSYTVKEALDCKGGASR